MGEGGLRAGGGYKGVFRGAGKGRFAPGGAGNALQRAASTE